MQTLKEQSVLRHADTGIHTFTTAHGSAYPQPCHYNLWEEKKKADGFETAGAAVKTRLTGTSTERLSEITHWLHYDEGL